MDNLEKPEPVIDLTKYRLIKNRPWHKRLYDWLKGSRWKPDIPGTYGASTPYVGNCCRRVERTEIKIVSPPDPCKKD